MSPRRSHAQVNLGPRRVRRGRGTAQGPSGQPRLSFVSTPGNIYTNRLLGPVGATIQLVDGLGAPILQAGVSVTVSLPLGALVSMTATPGITVATDANGRATFTGFTFTGTAGNYVLTFSASGFTAATFNGLSVVAGAANAAQSTANVPPGSVGAPTAIQITLRDQDGNILFVAASGAVTVQVTGANSVPATTVPFVIVTGYQFTYTPAATGTDTVTVKYAGTNISGSPYTSIVATTPGFTANSLRYGLHQSEELLLKGPVYSGGDWTTQEPIYRIVHGTWTPANINAAIAAADTKNVVLLVNMLGSKASYSDVSPVDPSLLVYNRGKMLAKLDTWVGNPTFDDAVARKRVINYSHDEPWITKMGSSMPPSASRDIFQQTKLRWPTMVVCARFEPNQIRDGWANQHGTNILPPNYFDKLDYSWATYRGKGIGPWPNFTYADWVNYARPFNTAAGYGTIWGMVWWNYGDKNRCWDYLNNGSSSGRVFGPDASSGLPGTSIACGATTTEKFFLAQPAELDEYLTAILADQPATPTEESPIFLDWPHADLGLGDAAIMKNFEIRADFVAKRVSMLNRANGRTRTFQWRPLK